MRTRTGNVWPCRDGMVRAVERSISARARVFGTIPACPPCPSAGCCSVIPWKRFEPQALLCTDVTQTPLTIVSWFVQRWQIEVTFEEACAQHGVESQRQGSDLAIARTTPCLFGLFSAVTLPADRLAGHGALPLPQNAWYRKQKPTFADALAAVRQQDWEHVGFRMSGRNQHVPKLAARLRECLRYALCRAA